MLVRLALRNLLRDRPRALSAMLGIAFASFLMAVQGGLLYGFSTAASRLVDAVSADIWITAKGIPSVEFGAPLPDRYADIARAAPGVTEAGRALVSWWGPYVKPDGSRTVVLLVGVEEPFLGTIPNPRVAAIAAGRAVDALVIDRTDMQALGARSAGSAVELGGRRAHVAHVTGGFASFLGTPFVFTTFVDARRYLRAEAGESTFILLKVPDVRAHARALEWLRQRLPETEVWTREQFSARSRGYWLLQTGAGAALTLSAVLGFAIGLAIVSQTIAGITNEYLGEFATLKAMGATAGSINRIVLVQSLVCGGVGSLIGIAAVAPFISVARDFVSWAEAPLWLYPAVLGAVLLLSWFAARIAVRPAIRIAPGQVFRA
jgi:putative ABC transport system permease protein